MKFWTSLGILLLAAAALALRLPQLDRRPMHTDESVHAIKFLGLWERGVYRYDPDEYHGPSLYYLTLPLAWASGARNPGELTESTLRAAPVIFGVGVVLLALLLPRMMGAGAALAAALLTAISPAMVFYSRYFIHEQLLVFFSLLFLISIWRYARSPGFGWAASAGAALALMQATKETFVFVVFAAVAGWLLAAGWGWLREGNWPALGLRRNHLLVGIGVAMVLSVVLFTSFFTNASGPLDAWRTYLPWFRRAEGHSPHVHPWHFYFGSLLWTHRGRGPVWTEAFIFGLGCIGLLAAFLRRRPTGFDGFWVRLVGGYTLVLTLVYTVIPYKTPWCMIGFLHGWILLAGLGVMELWTWARRWWGQAAVALVVAVGSLHLAWQAYQASYVHACSQRNPFVYAHTLDTLLELVERVDALMRVSPAGYDTVVQVMARGGDYWPLPWYLRRCRNVGWYDRVPPDAVAAVIVASPDFAPALRERLAERFEELGYFGLRPAVFLQLHVERDLWDAYLRSTARE